MPCRYFFDDLGNEAPRVSNNPRFCVITAALRVRYAPVPCAGAVLAGTGVVSTGPTRTVPVRNPKEEREDVTNGKCLLDG